MNITLKVFTDPICGWDSHAIGVDGKRYVEIHPLSECPEDAIIGRGLFDGKKIIAAIRLGYEAGRRGEAFSVDEVVVKELDDLDFSA